MTVKEVLDLMNSYSGLTTIAVVVLASLLEVSKIKINPWSWIGGLLNKNVMCKVDKIEKTLPMSKEKWAKAPRCHRDTESFGLMTNCCTK